MINGFSGRSAVHFINATNTALAESGEALSRDPFQGREWRRGNPPNIRPGINQRAPFSEESGMNGGHTVGVGNATNIVVDEHVYEDVVRQIGMLDEEFGADLYRTATAIEEMCTSMYVAPETTPLLLEIASQLKSSLGQFRSLTEEASIQTRRFVDEMMEIDMGRVR